MENEIFTEAAVKFAYKKTDLAHAIAARGQFSMKAVAQAMRVSRSHLVERRKTGEQIRENRSNADD